MQLKKTSVILFDVNETLIDMSPLKKRVNHLLGTKNGFRIWFGMLLQYSLVDNCTNQYHDFSVIASATLGMAARSLNITIEQKEILAALSVIKELEAYPEVEKGLKILQKGGFRLATLTNSPARVLLEQLDNSRLTEYFELKLSIDTIKKYKPAKQTYHWAAKQLKVNPDEIIMVAAHGWDIAGALQAGLQAGFIERKGQSLYPLATMPYFIGKDLIEIANSIVSQKNA